jgi:tetratricopeptide (TPR) repeat protein
MLFANPVFGVGFDNFKAHYMNEQANWFKKVGRFESPESQLADNTMYAFNEPLQFAVENGLTGVFLIILVIVANSVIGITDKKDILITLSIAIAVTIVSFGMLTYLSDNLSMKLTGTFALAIFATYKSRKFVLLTSQGVFKTLSLRLFIVAILMSVTVVGMSNTIKCRQLLLKWKQAQDLYQQELYGKGNEIFETIVTGITSGELLMQYGKSLYMSEEYSNALMVLLQCKKYYNSDIVETTTGDCQKKLGNYSEAEKSYTNAMYMAPNRFYPLYLLMLLYEQKGQKTKARVMANAIINKNIKVPSKAVYEIKNYALQLIKKNNYE